MRRFVSALSLALAACASGCTSVPALSPVAAVARARAPVTILVSIDGFRPDYLDRGITPNLNRLAASGIRGALQPSFPTKTFPNHYTLVTGLRPDRNGIVDNSMEDGRRPGVRFTLGDAKQALDPFWWDEAEPIWVTAQKAGLRTATMFWPGTEVAIGGVRPANWARYDMNVTNVQRVEGVIDWMRRPAATRPRFVTLYFDTVDTAGHDAGPDAAATNAAIAEVDARVGDLVDELAALGQAANLVIVADHGMAAVTRERIVPLSQLVDPALVRVVSEGPYLAVEPVAGRHAAVAAALLRSHAHATCWRKANIPARFYYGRNPRVPPFFCLAETGWLVTSKPPERDGTTGAHGYDNQSSSMAALFLAHGPAFAGRRRLPVFDNVEVYPLLARLLGIAPLASDASGSLADAAIGGVSERAR